jgi:hypothetical protein
MGKVDIASFYFRQLAAECCDFKVLYSFLVKKSRMLSNEVIESVKVVVDASDYGVKSRNEAMKMMWGKERQGFMVAAAETDCIDEIEGYNVEL